ncbi:MAG: YbaN family protein [Thalassobaculum sp.]|uniref:YbaN family protein n=1 Tax=Thalassobaculum sp. TaxID=2022740 RepID=UPI0032EFFBEB
MRRLCGPARGALLALGFVCTAVGIAGVILPGLPGTVFLLIAAWAFSRSSERFHLWLYEHPRFGRTIRDWHAHRVIPVRAKVAALSMMAATAVGLVLMSQGDWRLPAISGGVMALVALWIVTRPSRVADVA